MTFLLAFGTMWGQTQFWVDSLQYETTSNNTVKVSDAKSNIVNANIPAMVTYNGNTYSVTSIGDYAFGGCSSLTNAGTEKYEINTSNLSAGVYYVAIKTQNGIATEKLIVK